jgi:YrbI family 3-deoxy-D-manno-octulosonate 8-phosphate phosphatase
MIVAFVPVRCGSKSIPFKNIKLFCGQPLIYWCLKTLELSSLIDKIVVATDCDEIKSIALNFKFSKVDIFNRSSVNASDTSSTESVILEYLSFSNLKPEDYFITVQVTSPFLEPYQIDSAFKKLINENGDSLLSCVRTKRFFWDENGNSINYNYKFRPRRQDFGGLLMENGSFYISTISGLQKSKNRLNGKIIIYEMPDYSGIEIDEPGDWAIAEEIFSQNTLKNHDKINYEIKLFVTDVDGTLTDAGMYYDQFGNELKKFNTQDGKGFELLRNANIKTGVITSEDTDIVSNRAKKLKVDYLVQGVSNLGKLQSILQICIKENFSIKNVAYIGDDINCKELLENVGLAACPDNAVDSIKKIRGILKLQRSGGNGAVREFIDLILKKN